MAADWTRRTLLTASGLAVAAPALASPPRVIPVWPNGPPGGEGVAVTESVVERNPPPNPLRDRYVKHVRIPTLTLFQPAKPNGASLLMTPGGGYKWVVMDKEGYECAARFAAAGVTVYVASYRLPADGWAAGSAAPLEDAQRALRLVRSLARDPGRIGVMGFSAGGHVAGCLSQMWDVPTYAPIDGIDALSARPDLSMLMYPVATMHAAFAHAGSREQMLGPTPAPDQERRWSLEDNVRPDAPSTFLLHAGDDASVPVDNSLRLYDALRAAKIPTEMHLFEEGGHGFGLRFTTGKPVAVWPELVESWWRRKGFV